MRKHVVDFPIGIYWPPPAAFMDDLHYDLLKDAHIDIVVNTYGTDINSVSDNITLLKKCEDRQMYCIVADKRLDSQEILNEQDISRIIDDYKDYKALAGFYLKDEPEMKEWEKYSQIYRKLVSRTPEYVPYINLLPTYEIDKLYDNTDKKEEEYTDYYEKWIQLVGKDKIKYLSYDHYPFKTSGLSEQYFLNLEIIRFVGLKYHVKTHCYLQSVGISGMLQHPDANQMRWNVFTSLAYGMKALSWFTWWTPGSNEAESFEEAIIDKNGNKTDLYKIVQKLNSTIKTLGSVLIDLTSRNVYHYGEIPAGAQGVPDDFFCRVENGTDYIISYFTGLKERKFIMVVNKSINDCNNLTIKMYPKPEEITEISKDTGIETNTSYDYTSGLINIELSQGEGRLFAMPTGYLQSKNTVL